jgi:ribosomal protein L11 methyltransferase
VNDSRWPQLLVTAGEADLEALEEALFAAGATSVTAEDAGDTPILEPAPGATPTWSQTRLRALFPIGESLEPLREALNRRWPTLRFVVDVSLVDRHWEREWLKHFEPMRFGRRLWVCPTHRQVEQPDAIVVDLDPGLAFGTGTHPSTASCLKWLDGTRMQGARVLDYGCGSGILAIAALKLGARHATCVDIDPQALTATRQNAIRNGVEQALTIAPPTTLASAGYDVVVANILAGPLIDLAPTLSALARPGAALKLAGILSGQAGAVAEAYRGRFDVEVVSIDREWSAVHGTRCSD